MKLRNVLVYGNRRYDPNKNIPEGAERLFRYYRLIQECMAAWYYRLIQECMAA